MYRRHHLLTSLWFSSIGYSKVQLLEFPNYYLKRKIILLENGSGKQTNEFTTKSSDCHVEKVFFCVINVSFFGYVCLNNSCRKEIASKSLHENKCSICGICKVADEFFICSQWLYRSIEIDWQIIKWIDVIFSKLEFQNDRSSWTSTNWDRFLISFKKGKSK